MPRARSREEFASTFAELPIDVSLGEIDQGPDAIATTNINLSTDFQSASEGAFIFESVNASYVSTSSTAGGAIALARARYLFSVDVATVATITYSYTVEGNTALQLVELTDTTNANISIIRVSPTSGTDTLTALIGPGEYEIVARMNGSTGSQFADPIASRFGRVSFTLTDAAVPEPASWALMIGGFGLTGAAMRRRAADPALA